MKSAAGGTAITYLSLPYSAARRHTTNRVIYTSTEYRSCAVLALTCPQPAALSSTCAAPRDFVRCRPRPAETLRLGSYERLDPSGRPGSARACLIARKVADCPSPERAALPILYCATAPELAGAHARRLGAQI